MESDSRIFGGPLIESMPLADPAAPAAPAVRAAKPEGQRVGKAELGVKGLFLKALSSRRVSWTSFKSFLGKARDKLAYLLHIRKDLGKPLQVLNKIDEGLKNAQGWKEYHKSKLDGLKTYGDELTANLAKAIADGDLEKVQEKQEGLQAHKYNLKKVQSKLNHDEKTISILEGRKARYTTKLIKAYQDFGMSDDQMIASGKVTKEQMDSFNKNSKVSGPKKAAKASKAPKSTKAESAKKAKAAAGVREFEGAYAEYLKALNLSHQELLKVKEEGKIPADKLAEFEAFENDMEAFFELAQTFEVQTDENYEFMKEMSQIYMDMQVKVNDAEWADFSDLQQKFGNGIENAINPVADPFLPPEMPVGSRLSVLSGLFPPLPAKPIPAPPVEPLVTPPTKPPKPKTSST